MFGPYLYESYRDSKGRIRTKYISGPEDVRKKKVAPKTTLQTTERKLHYAFFGLILNRSIMSFLV